MSDLLAKTLTRLILAAGFLAALAALAPAQTVEKDYLSAIEADKIRDAETPNEKIKLWDPLESTCRHASLSIL